MKKNKLTKFIVLITLTLLPCISYAQYGSLRVHTGKGRLSNEIGSAGFAGLSYSYHLNNTIAFSAGFTYAGSGYLTSTEANDDLEYGHEADFSNHAYTFRLSPELTVPLKLKGLQAYLRPDIGLTRSHSSSDLYKVGILTQDDLDEDDYFIHDNRAHDDLAKSKKFASLFLGVEGGLRLKVGKIYSISLFGGINNTNFVKGMNDIIDHEAKWKISTLDPAHLLYAGIGVSMPIHGFIAVSKADL